MQRSFATVGNEKTLAALARGLFDLQGTGTTEAQKMAEAALLRANPGLAEVGGLTSGRIIVVPTDTGLKLTDRVTTPKGDVEGTLQDTAMRLKLAGQLLHDELDEEADQADKTLAQLNDTKFVNQLKRAVPESASLIPKTRMAIHARAESNAKVKAQFAKALEQATTELERLMALAKRVS